MIDTIRLGYRCEGLSDFVLDNFIERTIKLPVKFILEPYGWQKIDRKQKTKHDIAFLLDGGKSVSVTYYPRNKQGEPSPLLLLEFSIPKLVYGTNVRMVYDLEEAAPIINKLFEKLTNLPPIDITKGALHRIDLCYNHQVESFVPDYLTVLSKLHYPHRRQTEYHDAGVLFASKMRSTTFYDKERREGKPGVGVGLLRQEQRINGYGLIKDMTGKNNPTVLDFDEALIKKCLEKDLSALNLTDEIVCSYNDARKQLAAKYSSAVADRLYGFLVDSQGKEPKELAKIRGVDISTVNRTFKMIQKAGISRALSESMKPLPKLVIDFEASRHIEN